MSYSLIKSPLMQPIIFPDDLNATFLQNLKVQLQIYATRKETKIIEQRTRDSLSSLLPSINQTLKKQNAVIRELASKWTNFIECWTKRSQSYEEELGFMTNELDEKQIAIDNLQEIVTHYEHKIPKLEMEISVYKKQMQSFNQKYHSLEKEYNQMKINMLGFEQEYVKLQEEGRIEKTRLLNEKAILIDQVKAEKNENIKIRQKVRRIQQQKQQIQKESVAKMLQTQKYINTLSSIILQKQQKMVQMRRNYQQLKSKGLDYSSCFCFHIKNKSNVHIIRQNTQQTSNLQQGATSYFLTMSLDQLSQEHSIFYMQNQLKMHMDPYFAHYVLTSQSVKIKEDCQQLLNLDAKPFYSQIVQKRVPMHLWDQWIRNKLRQMLSLRRSSSWRSQVEE